MMMMNDKLIDDYDNDDDDDDQGRINPWANCAATQGLRFLGPHKN